MLLLLRKYKALSEGIKEASGIFLAWSSNFIISSLATLPAFPHNLGRLDTHHLFTNVSSPMDDFSVTPESFDSDCSHLFEPTNFRTGMTPPSTTVRPLTALPLSSSGISIIAFIALFIGVNMVSKSLFSKHILVDLEELLDAQEAWDSDDGLFAWLSFRFGSALGGLMPKPKPLLSLSSIRTMDSHPVAECKLNLMVSRSYGLPACLRAS